ncbi:MAG: PaaI family thioesterase [Chloroflexi bacterium]|nr:MAG: PaaI family thioesterase [Chloroflexota bacterium]
MEDRHDAADRARDRRGRRFQAREGLQVLSVIEHGKAIFELEAGPQHANPMGTLHGGVLCDVADAAMGVAYASTLADDESFTTLELKINFVRPFWSGTLMATGRVVKAGRTVGLTECDVTDSEGRLVARAMSTCMTLRGDPVERRR